MGLRRPQVAERPVRLRLRVLRRIRQAHAAAASYTAAYLDGSGAVRSPSDYVLESSRRARGFAVWAALRELGRDGVAELVDRCCRLARRFADGLAAGGAEVVNDVVLNQVLVSFGRDARTDADRRGRAARRAPAGWAAPPGAAAG